MSWESRIESNQTINEQKTTTKCGFESKYIDISIYNNNNNKNNNNKYRNFLIAI